MAGTSVLVIGGGIAGLSAAVELARNGVHSILIEARDRLGGRIHTVRHGQLPIELGAEFIHGANSQLWNVLQASHLETKQVSEQNQLLSNGTLHKVDVWD